VRSVDGYVLPVDKPEGPTSHDVVVRARRALAVRKIGHTGTLDPFASGLLLLCVGPATRLAEYLTGLPKRYEAVACLGVTTDTLDREGAVVEEHGGWEALAPERIDEALSSFLGDIEQVPPQFSAKKVEGVAMHRRARAGERVDLSPCPVTIHEIERLDAELPDVRFRVLCSSGTYVRALARDLGERLGVGAHLSALRRTAIGVVDVGAAIGVDDLDDAEAVARARIGPLEALAHLPELAIDDAAARRLAHGQMLRVADAVAGVPATTVAGGPVALSRKGELVAVAEVVDGVLRPRKVFVA